MRIITELEFRMLELQINPRTVRMMLKYGLVEDTATDNELLKVAESAQYFATR